jgi:hypothetical protein
VLKQKRACRSMHSSIALSALRALNAQWSLHLKGRFRNLPDPHSASRSSAADWLDNTGYHAQATAVPASTVHSRHCSAKVQLNIADIDNL